MDARGAFEKAVAAPMALVLALGTVPAATFEAAELLQPEQAQAATSGTWHGVSYDIDDAGNVTFHEGELEGSFRTDDPFSAHAGLKDATSVRADGAVTLPANSAGLFYGCSKLASVDLTAFDTSQVMSTSGMFSGCTGLRSVNLSGADFSKVVSASNLFYGCARLSSVDLSALASARPVDFSGMFSGCTSLASLDVSALDTSKAESTAWMFSDCSSLRSLDLSGFRTSQVTTMREMLSGCSALESVDLSSFDTSQVQYLSGMFSGCSSLASLDLSSFDTSRATNMEDLFKGCSALSKVTLGAGFSFDGAASEQLCSLPAGTWLSSADGKRHVPKAVPDNVTATYTLVADAEVTKLVEERKAVPVPAKVGGTTVILQTKVASGKKRIDEKRKIAYVSLQKVKFASLVSARSFHAMKKAKKSNKTKTFSIPESAAWHGWRLVFVEIAPGALQKMKRYSTVIVPGHVEKIGKYAFRKASFKKLVLRTRRLVKKKSVRLCLKGSKMKIVKAPKSVLKKSKKVFTRKIAGRKVKVVK